MTVIDKRVFERILLEQQEELNLRRSDTLFYRPEVEQIDLGSPQAQVVIGVRRSGKSTLCFQALEKSGCRYAYVNFDDERLAGFSSAQFDDLLEVLFKIHGEFECLFLDAVQNVEGWHLFVNRLLRTGMHVLITGSNAKLLSSDLATHLTGRTKEICLFPFSFANFCAINAIDTNGKTTKGIAMLRRAFDAYMLQGGFPELMRLRKPQGYVQTLVRNILQRDIEQRFSIAYHSAFERLSEHLLNTVPAVFSTSMLAQAFDLKSQQTVRNYVAYLQQAFLLLGVRRFSFKSRLRITHEKLYPIDVALMSQRENAFAGENLGWRLEAAVCLELLRRHLPQGHDVYYFEDRSGECDFLVCQGNRTLQAIQVSYDIADSKTRKREIKGLVLAAEKTRCSELLLLTDHESFDLQVGDRRIAVRPVYEWALSNADGVIR